MRPLQKMNVTIMYLLLIFAGFHCKKGGLFGENLPAATQEGKNTCGFLVNGKVWLPKGDNGSANLSCYYDETFMGGAFNINGYRYEPNKRSSFVIGGRDIQAAGTYKININPDKIAEFSNAPTNMRFCIYDWYDTIPGHNAFLTISKLDKVNRIISGTFEFAVTKPDCEEIRVNQGRFDMKY